jgi:hypothetical protein
VWWGQCYCSVKSLKIFYVLVDLRNYATFVEIIVTGKWKIVMLKDHEVFWFDNHNQSFFFQLVIMLGNVWRVPVNLSRVTHLPVHYMFWPWCKNWAWGCQETYFSKENKITDSVKHCNLACDIYCRYICYFRKTFMPPPLPPMHYGECKIVNSCKVILVWAQMCCHILFFPNSLNSWVWRLR